MRIIFSVHLTTWDDSDSWDALRPVCEGEATVLLVLSAVFGVTRATAVRARFVGSGRGGVAACRADCIAGFGFLEPAGADLPTVGGAEVCFAFFSPPEARLSESCGAFLDFLFFAMSGQHVLNQHRATKLRYDNDIGDEDPACNR